MKSLRLSRSDVIQGAYVITLAGNRISETLSQRALNSCHDLQQRAEIWPAFDGTSGVISTPSNLQSQSWIKWVKVYDHWQSPAEIATSLSHISLWAHCIEIDQPLIVLEHDAVMIKPLDKHRYHNTVQYLGGHEQVDAHNKRDVIYSSINENWLFMNRAHAYSIDPAAARQLMIMVMQRGIFESLDVMINIDTVSVIHDGIYAYDKADGYTTISRRKQPGHRGPGSLQV